MVDPMQILIDNGYVSVILVPSHIESYMNDNICAGCYDGVADSLVLIWSEKMMN